MNDKRFIVETGEITDCKTGKSRTAKVITDTHELCSCEDLYELCDDLNKLAEENEQLRKDKEQIKEKSTKNEELIQKKLTNVLLAKIYVSQLSLNPNLPYVEESLKNEMKLLDKKIRELCGDVFND